MVSEILASLKFDRPFITPNTTSASMPAFSPMVSDSAMTSKLPIIKELASNFSVGAAQRKDVNIGTSKSGILRTNL